MKTSKRQMTMIKGFVVINVLWFLIALLFNKKVLPTPFQVYWHLQTVFYQDMLLHIVASLYRVVSAIGISIGIGLVIGLLMAYSHRANRYLEPVVYFTYPIPKTVLLPMIMLLFGLGDESKVLLMILIIIFQVIVVVRDSILAISDETYNLIISLGASKLQIFKHITLPAILPDLLTNLRLSIGTALSILFFAEAYGTKYGLGYYILDSWTRMDYLDMYTGIVIISLIGFSLFLLIDFLEKKICRWNHS